jgi:hypothetical protein
MSIISKADQIRALAAGGMATADIARHLGIRYQHAYQVLARSKPSLSATDAGTSLRTKERPVVAKPMLTASSLLESGFELSARWVKGSDGDLVLDGTLRADAGVYAFVRDEIAVYVGVATMGLAKRLYFYRRPGITQTTSIRIKGMLLDELGLTQKVDIYTAVPPELTWNGLPVGGAAGLEHGLIKNFHLPWNKRGAR